MRQWYLSFFTNYNRRNYPVDAVGGEKPTELGREVVIIAVKFLM